MTLTRGEYEISDDQARLDIDVIHALLSGTYWAAGRSRELIATAVRHSVCFGMFHRGKQMGFGRVITDRATSIISATSLSPQNIAGGDWGSGLLK